MNRLFRNHGGYAGETLRIGPLLESLMQAALRRGWTTHPIVQAGPHPVIALHRHGEPSHRMQGRLYLSAGIHGDEPAGPLAMLRLIEEDVLPRSWELFACPCLNPEGFERNTRTDAAGVDLNRDYRTPQTPHVRAHRAWLDTTGNFDATFLLHEDWEADGFYLYELCRDPARPVAKKVAEAVARQCPLLQAAGIDGWPAQGGIVRPDVDPFERPDWPEAIYLFTHKAPLNCTFEAPSDYPMPVRTSALVAAVQAGFSALEEFHPG